MLRSDGWCSAKNVLAEQAERVLWDGKQPEKS
jgi:hypothetical protein